MRMSLNDYLNSLIAKAKDAPFFVFNMNEEDFNSGKDRVEELLQEFERNAKANNIKITSDMMLDYSVNKIARFIADQVQEEVEKKLIYETKKMVKKPTESKK